MATTARLTENSWVDPRSGEAKTYWSYRTPRGRTYFSFDNMEWHRTFKEAALAV